MKSLVILACLTSVFTLAFAQNPEKHDSAGAPDNKTMRYPVEKDLEAQDSNGESNDSTHQTQRPLEETKPGVSCVEWSF